jgi:hypothetical protein
MRIKLLLDPRLLQEIGDLGILILKLFKNKSLKLENSNFRLLVTPRVGFEPTTNRLTADRSATELPRIGAFCLPHLLIVIRTY